MGVDWQLASDLYPAILDEDVAKTLIPLPTADVQDRIAAMIQWATAERERAVEVVRGSRSVRWRDARLPGTSLPRP